MDLVDALSSNLTAKSVVELSLNPCFRRDYSSLFAAIDEYQPDQASKNLAQLAAAYLPPPTQRTFWLLGTDVTSQPRPFASRLDDRGYVYQPNLIQSNKPVTVGHQYSEVAYLPERAAQLAKTWVVPLSTHRVESWQDKELVGAEQIRILLEDDELPFHNQLCAEVADSAYAKPAYLHVNRSKGNLVTIVRVRSKRTFYRPSPVPTAGAVGHPTWFGDAFCLRQPDTWHDPDETYTTSLTSRRGRVYRVEMEAWHDMLMRGERNPVLIPMQRYPFTLVRIRLFKENGELAYAHPMWLIVVGDKRSQLSLEDIFTAYNQRYDLEHFFRFGKQRLLLTRYQTPETKHEERWWVLAHLAYLQLWVARQEAACLPRPWERSLPEMKVKLASPAQVQRDFGRIIRQFGTPASAPKRRGNSPGRRKGTLLARRERKAVIYKGKT